MSDGEIRLEQKRGKGRDVARSRGGDLRADGAKKTTPVVAEKAQRIQPIKWAAQAKEIDFHAIKKRRRIGFFARLGAFVLLPTLLVVAYVFWYATPRYVSEAQVAYQANNPNLAASSSSSLLSSIIGSSGVNMAEVMQSFLTSAALLNTLDKRLNLRAHYSDPKVDWLDRLSPNASAEKFLTYFNRRLAVNYELGGYLVIDVEAFDPKFAKIVCDAMVEETDKMVSGMMNRPMTDTVNLAAAEVKRTEERLRQATVAITKFRNEHGDVNLVGSSNSLDTVVDSLEAAVSQTSSELTKARASLAETSPPVVTLKTKIAALQDQIQAERRRLGFADSAQPASADLKLRPTSDPSLKATGAAASPGDKAPYAQVLADYAGLEVDLKFATDTYVANEKAYDIARDMAATQAAYAISFVPANLPVQSTSPDWTIYIPSAFLLSLFLFIIGSLLVGAMKERAGI